MKVLNLIYLSNVTFIVIPSITSYLPTQMLINMLTFLVHNSHFQCLVLIKYVYWAYLYYIFLNNL